MTDGATARSARSQLSNARPQPSEAPPAAGDGASYAIDRRRDSRRNRCRPLDRSPTSSDVDAGCRVVLLAWLAGVALLTLRLLAGWLWVQRLRSRGTAPAPRGVAADGRPAVEAPAHRAADPAARVRARRSADGHRLAEAGRAAAGERAGRAGAAAARSDPRARARAHPPSRLPGQPAADAGRDAALLSPGRLVAVAPHPDRARELLRRPRGQPVRRSVRLRERARRSRGAAR